MKLRVLSVAMLTLALASSLVLVGCKKEQPAEDTTTSGVEEAAPAPEAAAPEAAPAEGAAVPAAEGAAAPAAEAPAAEGAAAPAEAGHEAAAPEAAKH